MTGTLRAVNEDLLIIPGTPVLVPELSAADPDAEQLRAVVLAELAELLDGYDARTVRPVIVRQARQGQATGIEGSFRAWGADVQVGAGHHLPELLARWCLSELGVPVNQIIATDRVPESAGPVIVVAEGPAALTPAAPLTLLPEAQSLDDACLDIADGRAVREAAAVIRDGDTETCGLYTADLWLQLAEFAAARDLTCTSVYRSAPYGVGYHVARWSR